MCCTFYHRPCQTFTGKKKKREGGKCCPSRKSNIDKVAAFQKTSLNIRNPGFAFRNIISFANRIPGHTGLTTGPNLTGPQAPPANGPWHSSRASPRALGRQPGEAGGQSTRRALRGHGSRRRDGERRARRGREGGEEAGTALSGPGSGGAGTAGHRGAASDRGKVTQRQPVAQAAVGPGCPQRQGPKRHSAAAAGGRPPP